ncbi:lipopolysaccharide assembly protein LapB [Flavobacterium sp. UMI-01]|uniref:tetratricopeptide repeat protein n=1 Tax=Flavobacterium sp. UMI-01 TaxID=1441053 RepID=UPI001C7DD1D7|nr:hypothetical protein [Flavobacterium sp. UMI-01]GIZ07366.1 hypothetical protein FUMI01_00930 [Flavobacterium sp. UMI-01]
MKWILVLLFPVVLYSQTNYEKAKSAYDKELNEKTRAKNELVLKSDPHNLKALEELGDVAGLNKDWDKALFYYGKLTRLKPKEANYHYKYGGTLGMKALEVNKFKALGMIGDIKRSFEKAIELDPKHIDAHWALIELYLKLPAVIGGSESKAIGYSNKLMALSSVDGYLSRGHIEEYYERYKSAEYYYKKAVELGGSKHTYQTLANFYKNKMDAPEKAKIILEEYKQKNTAN